MEIRPSALNVIIILLSMIVASFMWRLLAGYVDDRNPRLAGAMGAIL